MPLYKFEASDQQGKIISGEKETEKITDVTDYLQGQGLIVVSIEESLQIKNVLGIQVGGMSYKEKVYLIKQLTFMLEAGLPIVQALEVLSQQAKYPDLQKKLDKVYKDVKGGLPLATSFAKQNILFDDIQISLIESGEKSGNLVEVLGQIAIDIEKKQKLKGKVKNAMIYPTIILITAIIVIIVLVIYMVPAVVDLYRDLGAEDRIPLVTRILVGISDFFTSPLGLILTIIVLLGIILGFKVFYSSKEGRKVIDKFYLRLPILGQLMNNIQVVDMTRMLSMLLKSGIPIIDSLLFTSRSMGNIYYAEALESSADRVSKGSALSLSLARYDLIPTIITKMIATGEDTGSLEKILNDLSSFYENEVNETTANLTSLIEPVLLLIVGGMVAFLAVAVYFPIYNIAQFF